MTLRTRGLLLAAAGSAAMLTGCGGPQEAATWDDVFPGKPPLTHVWKPGFDNTSFEELFEANCMGCHSNVPPEKAFKDGGILGAALPLADPLYLALVDDEMLTRIIEEGVEGTSMPPFGIAFGGPLTDAQIAALVKGMRENWGTNKAIPAGAVRDALPPYEAPLGNAAAGKTAYATYCASCHGPDGTGGPHGQSIVDPNYLALVSDQGLRTVTIVGRKDFGMPDFTGYVEGQKMSNQEIADVVAWMASQRTKVWKVDDEVLSNETGIKTPPRAAGNPADMPGQPYGTNPENPPAATETPAEPAPAPEADSAPAEATGDTSTPAETPAPQN